MTFYGIIHVIPHARYFEKDFKHAGKERILYPIFEISDINAKNERIH